jgi:Glyoxalase-like domain
MVKHLSRRLFLSSSAATLAAIMTSRANSPDAVPESLDHILLGCNNLDSGIAFVEAHTGVRATAGGAHPGAGTHNALLSLGERRYLEIIAPDPAQPDSKNPLPLILTKLSEPRLVAWAAHPANISSLAEKLRKAGVPFEGPVAGSRKRLDGHVLRWQVLHLEDDDSGLLPFFIEWGADSTHPSVDSPRGCRLSTFELITPNPEQLSKQAALLSLDVAITKGPQPQLDARLLGPKGELNLIS